MIVYLDTDDLLAIAEAVTGAQPLVRDHGLLASAAARPQASVFGEDAYPSLQLKAAALLHSLARNHALVDGNKRLAWAACATFLHANGRPPTIPQDEATELVVDVAEGRLDEVEKIAARLG